MIPIRTETKCFVSMNLSPPSNMLKQKRGEERCIERIYLSPAADVFNWFPSNRWTPTGLTAVARKDGHQLVFTCSLKERRTTVFYMQKEERWASSGLTALT